MTNKMIPLNEINKKKDRLMWLELHTDKTHFTLYPVAYCETIETKTDDKVDQATLFKGYDTQLCNSLYNKQDTNGFWRCWEEYPTESDFVKAEKKFTDKDILEKIDMLVKYYNKHNDSNDRIYLTHYKNKSTMFESGAIPADIFFPFL